MRRAGAEEADGFKSLVTEVLSLATQVAAALLRPASQQLEALLECRLCSEQGSG